MDLIDLPFNDADHCFSAGYHRIIFARGEVGEAGEAGEAGGRCQTVLPRCIYHVWEMGEWKGQTDTREVNQDMSGRTEVSFTVLLSNGISRQRQRAHRCEESGSGRFHCVKL
jgi:hypothetical protein